MPFVLTFTTTPIVGTSFFSAFTYIGPDGGIVPTSIASDAIRVSGTNLVTVDGLLVGYNAIAFVDGTVTTNMADIVNVRAGGLLSGAWGAGISFIDDGSQLINAGQITGNVGVQFDSVADAAINNSGTINGIYNPSIGQNTIAPLGTGVGFSACSNIAMQNSGQIEGAAGLWLWDSSGLIDNSGIIRTTTASGTGIYIASPASPGTVVRIVNSGEIHAASTAIAVQDSTLRLSNLGLISGDVLLGIGDDRIQGGSGTILGAIVAGSGNDRILSGLADDDVRGGIGNDTLSGGAGDDTLNGDVGLDRLLGGVGDDSLLGGGGQAADGLFGGAGDDTITGGDGADLLDGGTGNDWMTGGTGADSFSFRRSQGDDRITDFGTGDLLDLRSLGFTTFAQLSALARDTTAGLFIDLASKGGGTILLDGFLKAGFDASDVLL